MTLEDLKIAVVIAWALVCSVVAVALASSATNWLLLVGVAVLPPLIILRMWQPARIVPAVVRGSGRELPFRR